LATECGTTTVVSAEGEFRIRADNRFDELVDAYLVSTGDKLFIRADRHLYCVQEGEVWSLGWSAQEIQMCKLRLTQGSIDRHTLSDGRTVYDTS